MHEVVPVVQPQVKMTMHVAFRYSFFIRLQNVGNIGYTVSYKGYSEKILDITTLF